MVVDESIDRRLVRKRDYGFTITAIDVLGWRQKEKITMIRRSLTGSGNRPGLNRRININRKRLFSLDILELVKT